MKKKATFILPGYGTFPIGGFRVIYEYATRLSQRGWCIYVVHPMFLPIDKVLPLRVKILNFCRLMKHRIIGFYLPEKWFKIGKKVKMLCVKDLQEQYIPDADYVVACPVQSASFVNSYSPKKGKKIYFIQHFEDWVFSKEDVEKTWKYPMKKIVIAKWLQEIAENLNETAVYIPNGLDFSFFMMQTPFEQRFQKSISFLCHDLAWKGTRIAIEAVKALKEKYPELKVLAFSAYQKPDYFPGFIEYHYNPAQEKIREIYNNSAIFISPSLAEGWPLPPAEAMMCGCVVIATDIGGHREYIEDDINGFLCKPASPESIIEKVEYVFSNPLIAQRISKTAPASLKKFDWNSRVDLFEKALLEA